jgi:hypothetical protein
LKRSTIAVFTIFLLFGASLYAGTTTADSLGLASTYTAVLGWFTDKYVSGLVVVFLVGMALYRLVAGAMFQAVFLGAVAIMVVKIDSIVTALTSATLPM